MNKISNDREKYVAISQEEYDTVVTAKKKPMPKKISLAEGKRLANKLINKWTKEINK